MYNNQLAQTGAGAVAVGGLTVAGWWMVALALVAVILGVMCVRTGFRRGREL
ncbi:hypothetical protein OG696_35890 [Streptomyces sp. NBC_00656]|uniref:hypothetical protein n=1 Tax=Streptomyces sp. NBC_00656 TaxID=2903668 RepID=UPI00324E3B33